MKMNYFVFGTNNMDAAIKFYDELFDGVKLEKITPNERMTYWIGEGFAFSVAIPFDKKTATNGNGTMLGLSVGKFDEVKRFYEKAIQLGGCLLYKPGQRGPRFSAYVRDLDNNKLCFSD